MKNIKIHILYDFKEGPYGGGNQFLKALRHEFIKKGVYEEQIAYADIVLFNSFQNTNEAIFYRLIYPRKIFLHRVDGPISLYRGHDEQLDALIFDLNEIIADGTIYQSYWSQKENHRLGMKSKKYETVIGNAADSDIFNTKGKLTHHGKNVVHLIANSWSDNWNKGFGFYKFLDDYLDFHRYSMTFVGRSPIKFRNIKMISALKSLDLADELRRQDIFITASKNDPCSNSLTEALQCGLPAAYLKSGGHPKIVRHGGVGFKNEKEMMLAIKEISINYGEYVKNIKVLSISEIGAEYIKFSKKINKIDSFSSVVKRTIFLLDFMVRLFYCKIKSYLC